MLILNSVSVDVYSKATGGTFLSRMRRMHAQREDGWQGTENQCRWVDWGGISQRELKENTGSLVPSPSNKTGEKEGQLHKFYAPPMRKDFFTPKGRPTRASSYSLDLNSNTAIETIAGIRNRESAENSGTTTG